ncbi:MAG: SMI1/KNR4 family protein [Rickettsiaceae bacterium]
MANFSFKLPKNFIELLKISDGGRTDYYSLSEIFGISTPTTRIKNPRYDPYDFTLKKQEEYYVSHHDIINNYKDPPDGFPEQLVAFAQDGGGNRTCFDYRNDPDTDNPPIVFWWIDMGMDKRIVHLADNFDEFIKNLELQEDDDDEEA